MAGQGGWPFIEASGLRNLGLTLYFLGQFEEALADAQSSIRVRLDNGARDVSSDLFNVGCLAASLDQYRVGVALVTAALRRYEEEGLMVQAVEVRMLENLERVARVALGDEGYEDAVRAGEALTYDEAFDLALSLVAHSSARMAESADQDL